MRKVSRSRKEIHLTVLVDGTKEDFDTMAKKIREMAVVGNHFSDRKMSYDIIWVPLLRSWKGNHEERGERGWIKKDNCLWSGAGASRR